MIWILKNIKKNFNLQFYCARGEIFIKSCVTIYNNNALLFIIIIY